MSKCWVPMHSGHWGVIQVIHNFTSKLWLIILQIPIHLPDYPELFPCLPDRGSWKAGWERYVMWRGARQSTITHAFLQSLVHEIFPISPFCCSEHSAFTSKPKLQTQAKGAFPAGESELHGDIVNQSVDQWRIQDFPGRGCQPLR